MERTCQTVCVYLGQLFLKVVCCPIQQATSPSQQVDPERVAEFFEPLPPAEELQLHEPQLHQHSKL